ncbi:hypothetical protein EYR27_20575 [Xanthomonas oryzae]|nr:hypothetical protein EYR27_20575 [Xanthomonas oryzae]
MVHADSEHRPRPPGGERSRFVSRSKALRLQLPNAQASRSAGRCDAGMPQPSPHSIHIAPITARRGQ